MSSETISTNAAEDGELAGAAAPASLPLRYNLRLAYLFSLLIALLTTAASIAGILYPELIYPSAELGQGFVPNDIINLFIGLPILLISMWLAWRGRLIGLLFWPGALFYGVYNYVAYLFGAPFSTLFPLHLLIVTLSVYTTIGLVAGIDGDLVKEKLDGRVPVRLCGGVLAVLSSIFILRSYNMMITDPASQVVPPLPEMGVLVADVLIGTAWVIGGILLWRRQPLGFVAGTGLLFQTVMLFIGVIVFLLLQPVLYGSALALTDIIVLTIMGLIVFIPFALYVRGVIQAQTAVEEHK